jgi:beta-galactosidase
MRTFALMIGLLLLAATLGFAQDLDELEVDHSVNSAFVTPHTDWATPYAQGKTRVLFFVNGRGTAAREVIELKQRFDFDPQMIFWGRLVDTSIDAWHGGENGIRRMVRLLSQKWDAFVFMGVSPAWMPVEQQYTMIKAITEGAGLVLVAGNDQRVLKDKNKLKALPPLLSDVADATAFTVKNGRGVRVAAMPSIPYAPGWDVAYDEWDMRLGKAILWAAGKEPKLSLTLTPKGQALGRPMLPGPAATLAWQGAGAKTVVEATWRRDDGVSVALPAQPLKTAAGSLDLQVPAARAGSYYLDVIARDGKNVAGFASVPVTVICQRKVDEVKFGQDWAEIGERLSGTVALSGQPEANERLVVSLLDRRDREVARQVVTPTATEGAFTFDVQPSFPMLVTVRATLMDGTDEVASAWKFARVTKRHRNQFNFVMWDIPGGNLAPWAERSLAESGVTVHLSGNSQPPDIVAAHDIAWIPYTIHIDAKKDEQGIMKPSCWNDEAAIQALVDQTAAKYVPSRRHGVFVYSLGDEIAVRGSCLSPYCLEAYRKYLQEQYGDIAALNASWGTTFASFDEVQLSKPDDNNEAEALRAGNFPRWYDRQAYQSYNFCKLCERFGKAFRAIDPQSLCGFEGAGTFRDGDDLDGFVRSNGWWSPYPGTADEVLRSIAPRNFPHSNWMGYTKDADTLLEKYWRMFTRGSDSIFWWRWEVTGRFHGWLSPNFDPYPANQEIIRDTRIVREGLGDLLLQSDMQTDGIGMLYSQPSAYAAKVQASTTFGSYENNHSAFHGALRDLGYNFRYFTDRQMRLGEVNLSQFKVIILPLTQAMSAQEAEMFRQYVRGGGVLIADVRPAIYDGHVKPLAAGQLDDVFGIKHTGLGEAKIVDGKMRSPAPQIPENPDLELQKIRVDGGVGVAGAQALGAAGETPLLLINSFGKGHAVLLNLAMSTYPSLSSAGTEESAAGLLQALLAEAKVPVTPQLTNAKGDRLRNVETTRWMNGPVQIVSVFRHQGQAEAAKLKLPQAMYAYDLKGGKDLGKQQVVNFTITPYRAMFFALSPQPLKPVEVRVAPTATPGSVQRVTIAATVPQGQQGVKVTVKLPNGAMADWAEEVVIANKRGATVDVPIALNDPTGKWTVLATDLYTGKTTSAQFSVK